MFFKRCLILSTFCLYSCGADFIVEMSLKISSNVLFIGKIQPTSALFTRSAIAPRSNEITGISEIKLSDKVRICFGPHR